jgi:protein gp37
MSDTTPIQWADATLNPWGGCTKVSAGCFKCYAEHATPIRAMHIGWGRGVPRHRFTGFEANARRLDRRAAKAGQSIRVFPSLCDWLDAEVPAEWLADFLAVVRATPHLTWILLTKRPELFRARLEAARASCAYGIGTGGWHIVEDWLDGLPPANVWFVFSAEDQGTFDRRAASAMEVPAVIHGVSLEPLLGPVDIWKPGTRYGLTGSLDWVITGGESAEPGDTPRRCEVFWIWEIIRACRLTSTPCFVKQLGGYCTTGNANAHDWPDEIEFTADQPRPMPGDWSRDGSSQHREGEGFAYARVRLSHPKGGDPAEWPEELHIRQWPVPAST